MQDLRFGVRMLAKRPGFTALAIITLSLAIGANTTVFSVVKNTLLTSVPYREPERLVYFSVRELRCDNEGDLGASTAEYFDWRNLCTSYSDIGIHYSLGYNLTGGDHPERVQVVRASASLLPLLGVDAVLGRAFNHEEDQPNAPRVALLSNGFWRSYFAGDPDVIGKTIELESTPFSVIGVLPASLDREWGRFDLWSPLRVSPEDADRGGVGWIPIARLKPGVSMAQAQAEMDAVNARLTELYPDLNQQTVRLRPFTALRFSERDRTAMLILVGAVGFVLLTACVNVGNLLLCRAAERRGEFALRAALGASRLRLIRQTLTEGAALALFGGVLGVLIAVWGVDLVAATLSEKLESYHIGIDGALLGFTAAISLATALLFGLAPALFSAKVNLNEILKGGSRSATGGRNVRRGRDLLLVGQIAMACITVICSGLLIKSFIALRSVNPGFDAANLLTLEVSVDRKKYPGNYMRRVKFFDAVLDRIRRLPDVKAAAAAYITPLVNTEMGNGVVVEDYVGPTGTGEIMVDNAIVTPGYFETLGIPVLRGRSFKESDVYGAPEALIVSRRAAEQFWPGQDPIGKHIRFGWTNDDEPWIPVVGVVGDITQHGLRRGHPIQIYRTLAQGGSYTSQLSIVARTPGDPLAAAKSVQQAVWEVDPDQPAFHARSMSDIIAENTRELQALSALLSVFAIIAFALAAAGLYGVVSHTVTQRTHEIGIRQALGARTAQVLRLVIGQGLRLSLLGVGVGLVVALAAARLMKSWLFGIETTDPQTFACASAIFLAIALLACYIPARRATKVDPMTALRCE